MKVNATSISNVFVAVNFYFFIVFGYGKVC